MIKIVFDMDGVLFDTQRIYYRTWFDVADRLGLSDITEPAKACIGTNRNYQYDVLKKYYGEYFPLQEFYSINDRLYTEYVEANGVPLKEGTIEILEFLKADNAKVAIASSSRKQMIENHLSRHNMIGYFDEIVGGDMVEHSKPSPDIYLKACQVLGFDPSDCYAVEDSYNGLRAAYSAGLKPVMVPDMQPYNEEIAKIVFKKFDSLTDLRKYLESVR